MWHPPNPIKHSTPEQRWPTEREAASSKWFQPIRLGHLVLAERTWVPAMVPWRATDEGYVTQDVIDWYERMAEGQPGAIVVEATGIRDIKSGPLLRIGHDRFIPGLKRLAETVKKASHDRTKIFIQVIDFQAIRRRPARELFLGKYLQITDAHRRNIAGSDADIRRELLALADEELSGVLSDRELESLNCGYRERVTDLDRPHIRDLPMTLPGAFSAAARRAEACEFDGIELHYAHAYTMASFLSALNDRADNYGGSLANRVRLPLEVFHAVKNAVSSRFVVGCRYLTEECIPGGSTIDDAVHFGVRLAEAGVDYLSLSRGGKFEDAKQPKIGWAVYPYTGPSGYECMPTVRSDEAGPFGRNIAATAAVRRALRNEGYQTPVVVSGGICTLDQAERILKRGEADIVASARQTLADPDWFLKIKLGRGDEIRRCMFTNYCEGLDQVHKKVTCKLWDRVDLDEPNISLTDKAKRRLVAPRTRDLSAPPATDDL